jgi:hypothetical protein
VTEALEHNEKLRVKYAPAQYYYLGLLLKLTNQQTTKGLANERTNHLLTYLSKRRIFPKITMFILILL